MVCKSRAKQKRRVDLEKLRVSLMLEVWRILEARELQSLLILKRSNFSTRRAKFVFELISVHVGTAWPKRARFITFSRLSGAKKLCDRWKVLDEDCKNLILQNSAFCLPGRPVLIWTSSDLRDIFAVKWPHAPAFESVKLYP